MCTNGGALCIAHRVLPEYAYIDAMPAKLVWWLGYQFTKLDVLARDSAIDFSLLE
jgi:hypothetical protein